MNYRPTLRSLVCAISVIGCSSSDTGDADTGTGAPQTSSATDPQTGTTADPGTGAPDSTTDAPTTAPTSEPGTTDEPGTTLDSDSSTSELPDTSGSDTTASAESSTGAAALTASATLEPKSGSEVTGTVLFTDAGGGSVDLVIEVSGVTPPGTHALHIHELPDCSAPDGNSTGNHWNPAGTMLGELGTVEIAADGTGVFMKSDAWSIGTGETNDVVAHSIIIHAEANGGTRIACGVIAQD